VASYSAALSEHLADRSGTDRVGVVRIVDHAQPGVHPNVVAELVNSSPSSLSAAASVLNRFDVAIVHHDYGIYASHDGHELLDVLAKVAVPTIAVLHTVHSQPTPSQRQVLERIAHAADAVVVMSGTAARRLQTDHLVDTGKVSIIPHGALRGLRLSPRPSTSPFAAPAAAGARPTILTWGLIRPEMGIEWAIEAVAALGDLTPAPRYLIAGRTHPAVRRRDGEAYRNSLFARAEALGVADRVEFDPVYRSPAALLDLMCQADVVLLPHDASDQAVSGVLVQAVVAGRPIVATRFAHAVELLTEATGLLVAHRDPAAMAEALRTLLTQPARAASVATACARLAPDLEWSTVAESYRHLAYSLTSGRVNGADAVTVRA